MLTGFFYYTGYGGNWKPTRFGIENDFISYEGSSPSIPTKNSQK